MKMFCSLLKTVNKLQWSNGFRRLLSSQVDNNSFSLQIAKSNTDFFLPIYFSQVCHHNLNKKGFSNYIEFHPVNTFCLPEIIRSYDLPSVRNLPKTYTFPTIVSQCPILEIPLLSYLEKADPLINIVIEDPKDNYNTEKFAVRLIRIRRAKMKKHKIKKLKKRMKFVWQRLNGKRARQNEVKLQQELRNIISAAEAFDAKKYVQDLIDLVNSPTEPKREKPLDWRLTSGFYKKYEHW